MIRVRIVAELPADQYGPRERYLEDIILPAWFAEEPAEAHARLLELVVLSPYFELPQRHGGAVPLCSDTVRIVIVSRA